MARRLNEGKEQLYREINAGYDRIEAKLQGMNVVDRICIMEDIDELLWKCHKAGCLTGQAEMREGFLDEVE